MQRDNHWKLPVSALLVCGILGLTLLMVPDHGKCVMTYMWPSYHSLTDLTNLGQQYELYLYKEGRQSMSNSRAKDMLVLPELNALIGVWPDELTVEADVRDMPGIWVSADHQALPGRSLTGSPRDHDQSDALDMTCCIVHAAVVAITATYTAVAALHDQPFRALYSVAFVCALDMACWAHSRIAPAFGPTYWWKDPFKRGIHGNSERQFSPLSLRAHTSVFLPWQVAN
ncbi:hypothetical protein WJX82_000758 [Trebouxia sp. C0006]